MKSESEVSKLLMSWSEGDEGAFEDLLPFVIQELRKLARTHLRKEGAGHTLQTTALINEAYLKLIEQKHVRWKNRSHFLAIASTAMRRILLDHAKVRMRAKRGGGALHIELEEAALMSREKSAELIRLDDALNHLAAIDPMKSRIVEMRHFGGMSVEETAEALGIAPITVMRHWNLAKAWLRREIAGE